MKTASSRNYGKRLFSIHVVFKRGPLKTGEVGKITAMVRGKLTRRALAFPLQHRALIALLGPRREALNQVHLTRDDQNVT